MLFIWILIFSFAGTLGTLAGASVLLVSPDSTRKKFLSGLVSYAVGALLAAAFLRLIPHALEEAKPTPVMATVLIGILLFFMLEKMLLWRHCHEHECEVHSTGGTLILVGDGFHNLVDGVLIAAAFMTSIPLGIATSLAIIVHEVPQEVGDFSILLDEGYSRGKAFTYNMLSSLTTVAGALMGYFALDYMEKIIPYVLALSASSFIYIATVDLIANIHRRKSSQPAMIQVLLILVGVGTIWAIGAGHSH